MNIQKLYSLLYTNTKKKKKKSNKRTVNGIKIAIQKCEQKKS